MTALAATSISTSPGPATGSGTSAHSRTSGPPFRSNQIAFTSGLTQPGQDVFPVDANGAFGVGTGSGCGAAAAGGGAGSTGGGSGGNGAGPGLPITTGVIASVVGSTASNGSTAAVTLAVPDADAGVLACYASAGDVAIALTPGSG